MLTNDELARWDRESFFHPSTHLGQFARGEAPQRIHLVGDAQVVQRDALDCIPARAHPVALLETLPRTGGDRRKAGVILLEAGVNGAGDARRQVGNGVRLGHAGLTREDLPHHTLAWGGLCRATACRDKRNDSYRPDASLLPTLSGPTTARGDACSK